MVVLYNEQPHFQKSHRVDNFAHPRPNSGLKQ